MAKVMEAHGYQIISMYLTYRGYRKEGSTEQKGNSCMVSLLELMGREDNYSKMMILYSGKFLQQ